MVPHGHKAVNQGIPSKEGNKYLWAKSTYLSNEEFGIRGFSGVPSFKFESTMRIRFMQHLIESMEEFQWL
jgi:hypothetical protein